MKTSELRDLSIDELEKKLSDLKDELFSLRFQSVKGQLSNFIKIREVKHEIERTKKIFMKKRFSLEIKKQINLKVLKVKLTK